MVKIDIVFTENNISVVYDFEKFIHLSMDMVSNRFFKEQREQSQVKATIVTKYFSVWANVIISTQKKYPQRSSNKIAYIDLFAGPGRYEDGTQSTPVMVIENAIKSDDICERLVTIFNDKDFNNTRSLENTLSCISCVEKLKYSPQVQNEEVGEEIVKMFENMNLVPTLFFVDPWGYKGLSLRLVNSVLKDWGCDCIFFFNYNRINMGLSNPMVKEHIDSLFGVQRADELRIRLDKLRPEERELSIVEELCQAIKQYGSRYALPFRFKDDRGNRTSHHLIFVSKHFRGYEIMKEIMAQESSSHQEGVPSFEYNPADFLPKQGLLFQLSRPLDDLKNMILESFSGRSLSMNEIYQTHNIDTPFIKRNYKKVLMELENEGRIKASNHKKGTFGDNVMVSFS